MNTPGPRHDTMLLASRLVVYALLAAFALVLLLVAGIMLFAAFADPAMASHFAVPGLVGIAMIAIAVRFLQLLARIVDSVAHSDPFAMANARRLREMAWLALAFQLVGLFAHTLGEDFRVIHVDGIAVLFSSAGGVSLHGFLLALVLFILARVFRHGTDLRDDVAGTV